LRLGKEHIYIWELDSGRYHEDEAAIKIANAITGNGIYLTEPTEGKVVLHAKTEGLLRINVNALYNMNSIDEIAIASIQTHQTVKKDQMIAGCRVVPLIIDRKKIDRVEKIANFMAPVFEVVPFQKKRFGVVTTGSEVYHGRIQDKFGPVVKAKVEQYGSEVLRQVIVDDKPQMIADAIMALIAEGAEIIVTTGGMSVDPDDVTPTGIKMTGGNVITYGAPVLPGSMFMLANIGDVPVMGLPGCVMYHRTTIFDIILPRILAGETVTKKDIAAFGHGGLCLQCDKCIYPNCGFGKGY
jgi:molybdenum cofactor synthesis domain-containing protein